MAKTKMKSEPDMRAEDFIQGKVGVVTTKDLHANKMGPRAAEQPIVDMDDANKIILEQGARIEKLDEELGALREKFKVINTEAIETLEGVVKELDFAVAKRDEKIAELEGTIKELDEAVTKLEKEKD